jgi:hypothetical protein
MENATIATQKPGYHVILPRHTYDKNLGIIDPLIKE